MLGSAQKRLGAPTVQEILMLAMQLGMMTVVRVAHLVLLHPSTRGADSSECT